jgi:hypothetical protein
VSRSGARLAFVPLDGDVGFYGATPIAQPAVLTAADATVFTAADSAAIDLVYGAEEANVLANVRTRAAQHEAVLNNLRTRVDQLEDRLQALGLLP